MTNLDEMSKEEMIMEIITSMINIKNNNIEMEETNRKISEELEVINKELEELLS